MGDFLLLNQPMKTQIEILKKYYGNYSATARALCMSPRRFRELRASGASIPAMVARLIDLEAERISNLNGGACGSRKSD